MPFTKALARSETETASSMVWTRFTDSISYDDNRYANYVSNHNHFMLHFDSWLSVAQAFLLIKRICVTFVELYQGEYFSHQNPSADLFINWLILMARQQGLYQSKRLVYVCIYIFCSCFFSHGPIVNE